MLVYLRLEFHLCGDPCIDAGQLSCKDADLVKGRPGLLAPEAHPARTGLHIRKSLRHDPGGIVPASQLPAVKVVKIRYPWKRTLRQRALRRLLLSHIAPGGRPEPSVPGPDHLLDGGLSSQGAAQLRHKGSGGVEHHVHLPARRLHISAMSRLLENRCGIIVFWL